MPDYRLHDLPGWVACEREGFADDFALHLSDEAQAAGLAGRLTLSITRHGGARVVTGTEISIGAMRGQVNIAIGGDETRVDVGGKVVGNINMRLWRRSRVAIGARTTSNGIRIVCDNSEFTCGDDCMFSDSVLIQSSDQHGIIDVSTGEIINMDRTRVVLGDHVWLGRDITIMPNVAIGDGSIIGTGSVVTRDVGPMSIAVGVPAKTVATGRTWCRHPEVVDPAVQSLITRWTECENSG